MFPSSTLATLRPDLGASVEEFNLEMGQQGFVGHEVLPVFEVQKASGVFGRVPIEQLLKSMPTERAPGSNYNRAKWKFESDSYITQEYGHEEPIDDNEAQMYEDYLDIETISAARARRIVAEAEERRIAALIQNATTWTPTSVGANKEWNYSDKSAPVPITDVEGAINRLWAKGIIANALIITRNQYRALRFVNQIIDKVASSGAGDRILPADINLAHLQAAFDLPHIIVAGGIKNTADDGQTASISGIWSDEYAAVTRIAVSGDIREPAIGRTFHWGGDGSQIGGAFETYRDETVRGDIVRNRHQVQAKILYTEALELLDNVMA